MQYWEQRVKVLEVALEVVRPEVGVYLAWTGTARDGRRVGRKDCPSHLLFVAGYHGQAR
jgi:hypothetical protein